MAATWIGIILSALQQLSGINAIMFYSNTIIEKVDPENARIGTGLVGVINFIATMCSGILLKCKSIYWLTLQTLEESVCYG